MKKAKIRIDMTRMRWLDKLAVENGLDELSWVVNYALRGYLDRVGDPRGPGFEIHNAEWRKGNMLFDVEIDDDIWDHAWMAGNCQNINLTPDQMLSQMLVDQHHYETHRGKYQFWEY